MSDTIFAAATAPGRAGVSVIRVSGPAVPDILTALSVRPCPPRIACLRQIRGPDGDLLDEALVLRFDQGASFTGESVAELHLHGSIAVQRAVHRCLLATGLCRLAEPGEFTRRALLNGRLDLTEVQGLADIIDAETEEQRRAAMRVLRGEMSARIQGWRGLILRAAALLEATIDFADEEVPEDVTPEVRTILARLRDEISVELDGRSAAVSLREGFQVAILGRPNAGKSSLLNAIAGSELALVSDIPGTTRDAIETPVDLSGMKVRFVDTAGLRETTDVIEDLGIGRARQKALAADLRIYLHEEPTLPPIEPRPQPSDLVVRTKADLNGGDGISARSGAGVAGLLADVAERLGAMSRRASFVTRDRDVEILRATHERIATMLPDLAARPVELVSDDLRDMSVGLARIVGEIGVEDVLDEVFRSFCLGK
jgi:tRNA modification GTPase